MNTEKMTQLSWAKHQLKSKGYVSRNDALSNRITRLAAIIAELRSQGYQIEGGWQKTIFGKDYLYYMKERISR